MDAKQLAKQMLDFNKTAFDSSFSAMSVLQDQTEKLILSFLDKTDWIPKEGKKAIDEWKNYKKAREDFKAYADETYKKIADYFAKTEKEETQKAEKKK